MSERNGISLTHRESRGSEKKSGNKEEEREKETCRAHPLGSFPFAEERFELGNRGDDDGSVEDGG